MADKSTLTELFEGLHRRLETELGITRDTVGASHYRWGEHLGPSNERDEKHAPGRLLYPCHDGDGRGRCAYDSSDDNGRRQVATQVVNSDGAHK